MKKTCSISLLILLIHLASPCQSCHPDSVLSIEQFPSCYRYDNIIISGQVTQALVNFLKSQGLSQAINLRTDKEIRKFIKKNFNEEKVFGSLDIEYHHIPVGDGQNENHPDKYKEIAGILNSGEKTLIYCKSGARARFVFMTWLVREKDCPEEIAREIAGKMGFNFSLDLLFGKELEGTAAEE